MMVRVIYGGTFDPPHIGHLQLLDGLHEVVPQAHIAIVPAAIPVHKAQASASVEDRLAMLRLLSAQRPWLEIDEREVRAAQACYTVDTLLQLRQAHQCDSLNFVMGGDSFANLHRWDRWQQLIQLANLWVVSRPGWQWPSEQPQSTLPQISLAQAQQQRAGGVVHLPWTMPDVASSRVRKQRDWQVLPESVRHYIESNELYLND